MNKIHQSTKIHSSARIEPGAVIYENCKIGRNSIIGANAVLRPGTVIGNSTIFGTCSVSEGDNYIGDNTTIHAQCHITAGMYIGNNVFIAPFFCQANTPNLLQGENVKYGSKPSLSHTRLEGFIEEGVVIGVGVIVNPGIRIGKFSKIDMNTYVTKDVPANSHVRSGKEIVGRIIGTTDGGI
ncbi:MAG: hypothetical protein JKY53_14685 [Flavobacteriales bacterium]|nr:hypothetical protein [Flavobacteriales bacterium]